MQRYPELRIGIVVGRDVNNASGNDELEAMKRQAEAALREKFSSQTLVNHPYVAAWRETYRSFGVKAKKYNPTCEALVRRILDGERIPRINVVVDTYLLTEAEMLLPCGGYELDKVKGDIELRFSSGSEVFHPLGGKEVEETNPGEVVYSDDERILTRKWNYRDCEATKITVASRNVALFSEAAYKQIPDTTVATFAKRLTSLLKKFCGGEVAAKIANVSDSREWDL